MPGQGIITIGAKQWTVSLATTPEELARGLGGLYAIPAGTGMLFDTEGENILSVTTAPMLFSIDIAFLNTSLVVNGLALNVAPGYLVTTEAPARFFLEVNAGEAQGVQKGQQAALQVLPVQATSWTNQLVSAVASVLALGLAVKAVGAVARQVLRKPKPKVELYGPRGERLLPETKAPPRKVYFVGACKVNEGHCLTHDHPVSETARCPQSPLTQEEWQAAFELVQQAFPEGQPNPWVNGWWPKSLEEAERTIRKYETSLWGAFRKYEARTREAVEVYRRSAERAIRQYRDYVMGEYARRPMAPRPAATLPQTMAGK